MKVQPTVARRIGIGLVAVCATLLSSSCATGQDAHTANETPAIDGSNGDAGAIQLHAVAIRAPAAVSYAPGGDAEMTLIIVNTGNSADTLTQVSSPRFGSAEVFKNTAAALTAEKADPSGALAGKAATPAFVEQPIAAGQSLNIGVRDTGTDTSTEPVLVLRGLTKTPLFPGESVPVSFTFADAGTVALTVPVQLSLTPPNASVPVPSGSSSIE